MHSEKKLKFSFFAKCNREQSEELKEEEKEKEITGRRVRTF